MSGPVRSATGYQLERLEQYSVDSTGKRIVRSAGTLVKRADGWHTRDLIRVKETRTYVQVTHLTLHEENEDEAERRRQYEKALSRLSPEEYAVLRLQGKIVEYKEVEHEVAVGDQHLWLRERYALVANSAVLKERPGLPPIEVVRVVGLEPIVLGYSHERIAEELGISVRTVIRRIETAQAKLNIKRWRVRPGQR